MSLFHRFHLLFQCEILTIVFKVLFLFVCHCQVSHDGWRIVCYQPRVFYHFGDLRPRYGHLGWREFGTFIQGTYLDFDFDDTMWRFKVVLVINPLIANTFLLVVHTVVAEVISVLKSL
jgi:hypothetical protein